ncbi:MAG: hypothetical protein JWP25_4738 [Bradyrhizobium sp.]|jgi:hypothetical protein|nr:hypothetical protein [Bradyrhizobium sp.]
MLHCGHGALCGLLRATLTPDDVAIGRADAAVASLDALIEQMRRDVTLREFNARYKAGRAVALARGEGFMGFGVGHRAPKARGDPAPDRAANRADAIHLRGSVSVTAAPNAQRHQS